ncbi:MAG: iron-containing alcohol dehydrogenase [Betaproteobacteria bacterium]
MIAGTHHWPAQERVIYGKPAEQALAEEISRIGAERIFVTTTRSITNGALLGRIVRSLGRKFAGKFDAIAAHSPREAVLAGAAALREARAGLIVAVGGGSVIDATKVMQLALWRGVRDPAALSALAGVRGSAANEASAWGAEAQPLRMVAIPTTLSAAEFFPSAGVTDVQRRVKQMYFHPLFVPRSVILDPAATLETPLQLLLSTGMRAVDHAVEGWCSVKTTPMGDAGNREAMKLLFLSLKAIKSESENLDHRAMAQQGMWLTRLASMAGIPNGASHGIGYLLGGGYGIPHGITSCVTLPAVMEWNESVNAARQAQVADAFGGKSAGDALRRFISGLGLPTRLRELQLKKEDLPKIAASWDGTGPIASNPRKVRGKEDLLEILELAW